MLIKIVSVFAKQHMLRCSACSVRACIVDLCPLCRLLRPGRARQYEALWAVLSAILWKVGEQQRVVVALPQDKSHVPHSQTYFQDGVTEKVGTYIHRHEA